MTRKTVFASAMVAFLIALLVHMGIEINEVTHSDSVNRENNGYTVLIDPGHGGSDPGAVSENGTKESVLNLSVATHLRNYLIEAGFDVKMTRGNADGADEGLSTDERKRIISQTECDVVISVHMNKFSDKNVCGAETFYYLPSEESKTLAQAIQDSIKNEADPKNNRSIKGVTHLYALKMNPAPSVLVECGYISNPLEEQKLLTTEYRRRIAFSIYCGILKYLNS